MRATLAFNGLTVVESSKTLVPGFILVVFLKNFLFEFLYIFPYHFTMCLKRSVFTDHWKICVEDGSEKSVAKNYSSPNTGCFSRRWPLLGSRKSASKKSKQFFSKIYSLKAHAHYFTVLIYLATWRAAKLGIFTHFTFTNSPQCSLSMNSLIYVCSIHIPSCFLWELDHSCDHTSWYYRCPKKIMY